MTLGEILEAVSDKWLETSTRLSGNKVYRYGVDVLGGSLFYTPAYAIMELGTGNDPKTVLANRVVGVGVHASVMGYVGKRRNRIAEAEGVTKDSLFRKQAMVNFKAITPVQLVVYPIMLGAAQTISGEWDLVAAGYACAIGVGFGSSLAYPFGIVQDRVRRFFGIRPAID